MPPLVRIALALAVCGCSSRTAHVSEKAHGGSPAVAPPPRTSVEHAPAASAPAAASSAARAVASSSAPGATGAASAPTSVKHTDQGRCEPTPKVGTACRAGDGYCVLSWGQPGGHSSALWCRDGRWHREEEVNLP